MITIQEAFKKFKGRLELNKQEQENATKRHHEVRDYLKEKFDVDNDFLTGSYARHTKTKPLKDVDIFFVLGKEERHFRNKHPDEILTAFHKELVDKYGNEAVKIQTRSVGIDFGEVVDSDNDSDYRIVSVDVVPSFAKGEDFEIPDKSSGKWMKTNPKIHADMATKANKEYGGEWKAIVRMAKYWNQNSRHGEKPIKPSFLIEVMALDCLYHNWEGPFHREIQAFFATLQDRIEEDWPDPAGLGAPVSDRMDYQRIENAKKKLNHASREIAKAINLSREGKNTEALKAWRDFFGPRFPLS